MPSADNAPGIIALANRIAHALLLGSSGNDTLYPVDELFEALRLEPALLDQIVRDIPDECNALKFSMIAQSTDETWPDYVSEVKQRFETGLRPLCFSANPGLDVVRIFCERITDLSACSAPAGSAPDDAPNLAVIYVAKNASDAELFTAFESREQEAECDRLPLLIISNGGSADLKHRLFVDRPYVILAAPVRVTTFVEAANDLLR